MLLPLGTMYRSAPLMAFVLRELGATVGNNLQCAPGASLSGPLDLISIEDDVAIQTGAYIQMTRWSGQQLHVGPVHLGTGCKIGMRAAIAENVTVGRGSWITPFTPILSDVGSREMWEGAPARLSGRCTKLKRPATICRYAGPIWLLESLNILMQIIMSFCLSVVPAAAILWCARGFMLVEDIAFPGSYFRMTPLSEVAWSLTIGAFITTWGTIVVTSLLGCLFIRCTATSPGLFPSRGLRAALLMYRMTEMNSDPETVDLDHHRTIPAGACGHALSAPGRVRMRRHVQSGPRACHGGLAGVLVQWLLHEHARLRRGVPQVAPARHAAKFLQRQ